MVKSLLFLCFTVLLFAGAGLYVMLTTVNPLQMTAEQASLFYTVLWLALSAALCLLLSWLARLSSARQFGQRLRLAALVSAAIVILLLLQANRLLSWANALPLLLAAVLLELFFRSGSKTVLARSK